MTSEVEHYMEKCRTLSARLVEVEQALRTLQDAVTEYQRTRPSLWGGNEPEDHEAFAAAMTALGIARLRARSVLDKAAARSGRLVAYSEWASAVLAVAAIVDEMGDGVSPECSGFADKIRAVLDKGEPNG